jgi:hypothetical protein
MPHHWRLLARSEDYRRERAAVEDFALAFQRGYDAAARQATRIQVVVHVLHNSAVQRISSDQVASQIEALNRDFKMNNGDLATAPLPWRGLAAATDVTFELATTDPDGQPSSGITYTQATTTGFLDDDAMKDPARGGVAPWSPDRYLNIWVCPLNGLLGYAQFPGGPPESDGVVIDYRAFGTSGTATAPYHLGRTAVHEIGHWLNLLHIWGDDGTGCAGSDLVDDTPNQAGPNTGRPAFPHITCDNAPTGDMFVNFMDYTDDDGMVMFTRGQVDRMHAALAGPRSSFPVDDGGAPSSPAATADRDLTDEAAAPDAAGDPVPIVVDGDVRIYYLGKDSHVHELRPGSAIPGG